ncbi:Eukaryotic translation initiation factor 4E, putative [Trypanosoma brucei brucei TREU927]|uniref:Eukaryotic translation initiation factor 4E, putative n=1 Tax=Trypanosoma brucei brucei (strain 927/4 GUTat10.1) TaxID=185431 RepID=Q387Q8_TRYB2|nr:eukaryotic translation initiation factor 4E [Trypanosoma brucei brucei TREU927]EAN78964.1 Eukaryotic translation initiation factor 4E, putative [Trypanosoma brucei brucei TREU927]
MQTLLRPRPGEPTLFGPPTNQCTQLWGVWEMWCVLPDGHEAATATPNVRGSGAKKGGMSKTKVKKATWLDQVRSIGLFDSAEGFWGIITCTLNPSQLPPGFNYYLFRRNIAPMWEHEANRRGGRWVMRFRVSQHDDSPATALDGAVAAAAEGQLPVDRAWEALCVAMIGEQLPGDETEICGAVVRRAERRRDWKLSLWTRTAADRCTQERIGFFVKDLLHLEDGSLQYFSHRELMQASEKGNWDVPPLYQL